MFELPTICTKHFLGNVGSSNGLPGVFAAQGISHELASKCFYGFTGGRAIGFVFAVRIIRDGTLVESGAISLLLWLSIDFALRFRLVYGLRVVRTRSRRRSVYSRHGVYVVREAFTRAGNTMTSVDLWKMEG